MIGDDIKVMVVEIRGDKVRLGIEAPKEVEVHRREVYDRIQKEKQPTCQHEWVRAIHPNFVPGEMCLKCQEIKYDD